MRKFILSKVLNYQEFVNKTYLSLQKQKDLKIIQQSDVNSCIEELNNINSNIKDLLEEINNSEDINLILLKMSFMVLKWNKETNLISTTEINLYKCSGWVILEIHILDI